MKNRQTLRKTLRLPLSLGRKLPALTADVSMGGFQAELPQVFLPGSRVDGYFLVNDKEVPFAGEVEWAQPGNPNLSLYSRIGVRFLRFPPALAKLMRDGARPKRVRKSRAK